MKRLKAYLLMSVPYLIGCTAGWLIFLNIAPEKNDIYKILLGLFLADLCATVVVWAFGVIFKNSSFYDAYWSLTPWLIVVGLMFRLSLWSAAAILFFIPFSVWSWRLTVNWAYTCKNIKTEDWRYVKYRAENKVFIWHIINFFGINLMPTIVVFAALIPGVLLIITGGGIGASGIAGAAVILAGTAMETAADMSMHKFRKESGRHNKDDGGTAVHNAGLWKLSRHPNYLGEIMIWTGVYISSLSVPGAAWWFGGMIGIILLFTCVSIPLAEKRQLARRPGYAEYKKRTRMLLPIPRFKNS